MEMEMEAPLPDFLSGLSTNVLLLINNHIPCPVQRRRLAQACRAFRDAVSKQQPAPPVLPWILLSRADGSSSFSCVLRGCDTHEPHDHGLDDIPVNARYSGSGGVFLVALKLLNLGKLLNLTDKRFDIPGVVNLGGELDLDMRMSGTTIVAATLLSSPREHGHCVVAAICLSVPMLPSGDDGEHNNDEYTWNELKGLDGSRMRFVGRGCSRSHGTTAPPSSSVPNQLRSWSELPGELLELTVRRLPWHADRIHASAACFSWLAAFAAKPPLPPQLPFLVLPWRWELLQSHHVVRTPTLYCVVDKRAYQMSKLPQARIFGSYDGGWLFVAHGQTHQHKFLNFCSTRSIISVPNSVLTWDEKKIPLTMLVATLCCAPPPVIGPIAPPDLQCIGAGIVSTLPDVTIQSPRNRFLLWFIGEEETFNFLAPANSWRVVDVIYHSGAFRFLTESEDMIDVQIHFDEERELSSIAEASVFFEERVHDDQDDRPHHVDGRYLVESRGNLLMVIRLSCLTRTTPEFKVFQMDKLPASPDPMEPARGEWTALTALDGRILFAAPGCSRSYEVADFPDSKEGIYFLDDRAYHNDHMMHSEAENREYSCSENGCWTEQDSHVDLWFPEEQTSSFSPPVWFLS